MTFSRADAWQRAGLATEDGDLDRPVGASRWWIPPNVALDGDRLVWAVGPGTWAHPDRGLLTGFVQLAAARPERIRDFARRYGVLDVCRHGLPDNHPHTPRQEVAAPARGYCAPLRGWEPLEVWRHYARQFAALLSIAARLHQGRAGLAADWRTVFEWGWLSAEQDAHERDASEHPASPFIGVGDTVDSAVGYGQFPYTPASLSRVLIDEDAGGSVCIDPPVTVDPWWNRGDALERAAIVEAVRCWASRGRRSARLTLRWDEGSSPKVELHSGNLFDALATQLMLAVGRSSGLAHCSGCGALYFPARQPRVGGRNYCTDCGRRAAMRDASRDHRRRKSGASSDV